MMQYFVVFQVSEWELGPNGLKYDREWMIVNDSGICLNQKREDKLCLVVPVIDVDNDKLHLTAQGL